MEEEAHAAACTIPLDGSCDQVVWPACHQFFYSDDDGEEFRGMEAMATDASGARPPNM